MIVANLAVHPGHAAAVGCFSEEYGNYPKYLGKMEKYVNSHRSFVWISSAVGSKMPFRLSKKIEDSYNLVFIISRLEEDGIELVNVLGEMLWIYTTASLRQRLVRYSRRLGPEKRAEFNILLEKEYGRIGREEQRFDMVGFSKKLGLDPDEVVGRISSYKMRWDKTSCCVKDAVEELHKRNLRTKTLRELCYPTNDPQRGI